LVIATGVLIRQEMKYLWAAYPMAILEAGDIGSAIYTTSEFYNLGCCSIQGFNHEELIKILDINPEDEVPLQVYAIGNYYQSSKEGINNMGGT